MKKRKRKERASERFVYDKARNALARKAWTLVVWSCTDPRSGLSRGSQWEGRDTRAWRGSFHQDHRMLTLIGYQSCSIGGRWSFHSPDTSEAQAFLPSAYGSDSVKILQVDLACSYV